MQAARHHRLRLGAFCMLAAGMVLTSEAPPPPSPSCPHLCGCDVTTWRVNCSYGRLSAVPEHLPPDATQLNLSHNAIRTLAPQHFGALARLLGLDLSDNLLAYIEVDAFLGLKSLINLHLARNLLKVLPVGAFSGLSELQLLDVSSNELLGFLDYTFKDVARLRVMKALQNDLVFISRQAFAGLSGLRQLHLDACNVTSVPTEALAHVGGLTSLYLYRLGSSSLPSYAFIGLVRLKQLVISDWLRLEALSANSLVGLNLTSLTIRRCNLSTIPYVPLHHLVYLVHLDLSYNPITHIHANQLGDLLRLQELHLVGGHLLHVELMAFAGLTNLNLLNVSGNLLSTLQEGVFHSVDALQHLGLDANPLSCDCRLLWLVHRHSSLSFGGRSPVCTTLQSQGWWNFLEHSEAEVLLTCRPPRIQRRQPQQVRVDQGHTVVFYCHAEGDPAPSVTWLSPQRRALSDVGRIRALANGSLEVRYAQPQDSGTYRCMASNVAGNDTSPISLQVQGFSSSSNPFHLKSWLVFPSTSPGRASGPQEIPIDVKTLLIAAAIGVLSFFSSVSVCFVFIFLWSKGKGQLKHTATIAYVPRSVTSSNGGTGNYMETSRFTMKLM
ncbi:leucine-rich repeat and immunoglobulin-like domain-containing nogo receptor-interacting protein 1 [Dunckerocampus dactyliophorus]|uniref:leucine-rich repeat and immunoglobulin-like domain-containing nogo receptor-interacting protein 1 n=1 Tax=Dunckerocampus dactyliophorus TaxID=161453 RepID=UPI0024051606|nr:leucine-rich repeat and immunoglobulin-like domain-containing nogo receptor-interacting protein 1 [Dunckerocampus dactyliophorus]XP_054619499.1 leucine-rich repeat and immunoglobulin-like domain-containing nogo receptor-interacting protein 1 [Dunckerocampus dactyliophorus]